MEQLAELRDLETFSNRSSYR